MFRKINQKTILILFAVLLVLVIGVTMIDKQKNERTFKEDLVEVNADDVNQILIYPKSEKGQEVKLEKKNDNWQVVQNGKMFPADKNAASSMVSELNRIKPESVASTSKERWKQYEVTDSLGTKVVLKNKDNKTLAEIVVGKMSFSQQRKATSFVRLANDNVVYGVDGYLAMSFNRNADSFRDKTITNVKKEDLTRLSITNPLDGTFVLEKGDKNWMIAAEPADSAAVADYLSGLQSLKHFSFAKAEPNGNASYELKMDGNNMQPVVVSAYSLDDNKLAVSTSQNKGNIFEADDQLKDKIFPAKSTFLK